MKRSKRPHPWCRPKQLCAAMSILLAVALFASPAAAPADELVVSEDAGTAEEGLWPAAPGTASDYYCVMDADSGAILAEKGMHVETPPASLTKIMTCLVALEEGNPADEVTMTKTGVAYAVEGSSNLYTQVGETFLLEDMLYGMMLKSANDIATQIGEHVGGGSLDSFLAMMNERAKELGCTGTHFANACGMPAEDHYSTAFDLCLISREALKNDLFREIVHTKIHTIPATNMNEERSFQNHHKFLVSEEYAYDGIIGGKTGYTDLAGSCLATYVERNGRTVIVVALHCNGMSNCLEDTRELCDFGLDGFVNAKAPLPAAAAAEGKAAGVDEEALSEAELLEGGILTIPEGASAADCEVETAVSTAEDGTQTITCTYTLEGREAGKSVYRRKDAGGVQELVGEAGTASGGEEILLLAEDAGGAAAAGTEPSSGKNRKKKKAKAAKDALVGETAGTAGSGTESAAAGPAEGSGEQTASAAGLAEGSGEQTASAAEAGAVHGLTSDSTEARVSAGGIRGVLDRGYAELPLMGRVGIVTLFGVIFCILLVIIVLLIVFNIHLSRARGRLKHRKKGDKDGNA